MMYPLDDRTLLKIAGEEAAEFLQGLVTHDVHLIQEEAPLFAALLTPQGKYLFDFILFKKGHAYFLDCELARSPDLLKRLKTYKLRAKVEIELLEGYGGYVVWDESERIKIQNVLLCGRDPRHPDLGYRVWFPSDTKGHEGHDLCSTEDYRKLYLKHLIPYGSEDLEVERSVILEYGYNELHALSWSKGCYIGQELMARTHHRGLVRKGLYLGCLDSGQLQLGDELFYKGEKVGVARMPVPLGEMVYALLLLRRDLMADFDPASDRLEAPSGSLRISDPEVI